MLIFWVGEGWYQITENSMSCAEEFVVPYDLADYVTGILPDADSESVAASREILRGLLACNIQPLRDTLSRGGPGLSKPEDLCIHSRLSEAVLALLLGRTAQAESQQWQEDVFRCLEEGTVARLFFELLPTESGGVFRDDERCVRDLFSDSEIAGGMLPRSDPDRATAIQTLIDGLRSCIPDVIISGEDAHPVDRWITWGSGPESSCVRTEVGEPLMELVLGKPFRPTPELERGAQSCLVTPTATAISLAALAREVGGMTPEHHECVRSYLLDSEFRIALLPGESLASAPAFREFAAGYGACVEDLLPAADDDDGPGWQTPSPVWQFSAGGPVVAAPTVSDGVVFAGSDDHQVYALDASSGALLWSFATADAVRSSPTVSDGVVYVGSDDHHLYALDAASGELLWKLDTGDLVQYQPAVSDGMVFLSARDRGAHQLHALDAKSGERRWVAEPPIAFDPQTAPTVAGSQLYFTSIAGDLQALSASTGEVVWSFFARTSSRSSPLVIDGGPVIADGRILLTADTSIYALDEESGRKIWDQNLYWSFHDDARDMPALVEGEAVYVSVGDHVFGNDVATGETNWSFQLGGAVNSPAVFAQGFLYLASDGGQFFATDPSKTNYKPEEMVWGFDLVDRTLAHPVVVNGLLYVQSSDGSLEAYNAANGHLIWTIDLGERDERRWFTVVENTVYVGAADGSVYAISTETPEISESAIAVETPAPSEAEPIPVTATPFGQGIVSTSGSYNDEDANIEARWSDYDRTFLAMWKRPKNIVQWYPDPSQILFAVGPMLYRVASDGSGVEALVDVSAEMRRIAGRDYYEWVFHAASVSPDATRVAYSTFEGIEQEERYDLLDADAYEIGVLEIDGGQRTALTANQRYDDYPTWSPDGSSVAYIQWDFESGYGLATVGTDGSPARVLVSGHVLPREATDRQRPVWSPDGGRIAFVGFEGTKARGPAIFTIAIDGSDLRLLTATNSRPAWSPDSTRIAFAKPDGDELALFTIAADGSGQQRVTTIDPSAGDRFGSNDEPIDPEDTWVETLSWSPDGSMILFSCGDHICIVTADGAHVGVSPLTLVYGLTAAWSPDGSRIALGNLELPRPKSDESVALYSMAPDGSDLRILLRHGAEGDLRAIGKRQTPEPVSIAGCAAGAAVANPADNPGLVRDCETLLSVRNVLAASPPLDWSDDRPITSWEGVAIGGTPPRVQGLDLRSREMSGEFPTELTTLTGLRELDLGWNKLTGVIPPEIGALTNLTRLDLYSNNLTGDIPIEIGRLINLSRLQLSSMNLHGKIPGELGQLTQLEVLILGANSLTGPIPLELTQLQSLRYLDLGGNELTGPIPPELANLRNLTGLNLGWNRLSGGIPTEFSQINGLDRLTLSGNQLTGAIPPELGELSLMRELFLSGNQLSGPIPETFGNFRHLWYLHVNDNQLTGPIPASLGNLGEMSELYLFNNQIEGPIPPEIGQLKNLLYFVAHDNRLTGPIPAELSGLSSVTSISLSNNAIDGPIPPELGQIPNLRSLRLDNNQLTGTIPPEFGELTASWILLNNNQLSGAIPPEIGHLSSVEGLWLQGNRLSGEIPPEIGQLFELRDLDLSDNQLSGAIPIEMFGARYLRDLNLSGNQLTGPIPRELLSGVGEVVNVANNLLTGSIPTGLGWDFGIKELIASGNQLTGPIPPDLVEDGFLRLLFLDGNQLTGEIPPEFGRSIHLEEINLSGNQLSGCIPVALRYLVIHEFESLGMVFCEE
ncbi:MAG: PQQ-binding-like beta-propeller repeat protein [Chloroflexi bacterium]|nr:PQQ-binding-like beta-propeller repeat protein [Chloroflexota bacterium]